VRDDESANFCVDADVDEAHVWVLQVPAAGAGEATSLSSILSAAERARGERFCFAADQWAFTAAHVLVRLALSWCAPHVAPREWTFRDGEHGRPEVAGPAFAPPLRFNLSHTRGLVACVVTRRVDCGVDVERVARPLNVEGMGRGFLTPAEQHALSGLPPARRVEAFVRHWTLKEAYAKARGLGMSLPFNEIGFDLDGATALLRGDADGWQFAQWTPTDQHVAAVALRRDGGKDLRLAVHSAMPPLTALAVA
jgi:4'-phosphopantetheinyl transferase